MRKLAFIHLLRTGGSYAGSVLDRAGFSFYCPWRKRLNRDWTRVELFKFSRREGGCVHSHGTAWDEEMNDWYVSKGWETFTIIRDPKDQLESLWHYMKGPCSDINFFVERQLREEMVGGVDFHFWEIPSWWRKISTIILYQHELYMPLVKSLRLPRCIHEGPRWNECKRSCQVSIGFLELLYSSPFYQRYRDVLEACNGPIA